MFKADNQAPIIKENEPVLGIHAMPKTSEKSMKAWFILGGVMLLIIIILFLLII